MGKILAICTSPKRGTVKTEVPSAVLTPEWGIVSDAHGGNWHRQVSLLSAIRTTIWEKPQEHHFELKQDVPATRGMYRIGG